MIVGIDIVKPAKVLQDWRSRWLWVLLEALVILLWLGSFLEFAAIMEFSIVYLDLELIVVSSIKVF